MKFNKNDIFNKNLKIDEIKLTKLSTQRFYKNNNNNNNLNKDYYNNYKFSDNSNNYDVIKINKNIYTYMIIYILFILHIFNYQ